MLAEIKNLDVDYITATHVGLPVPTYHRLLPINNRPRCDPQELQKL